MDDDQARHEALPRTLADRCSLDGAELEARLGEIEELIRRALRDRRKEAGATVLSFDPAAAAEVRDLVRRERDCCGHLQFTVEETDEAIRLAIRPRPDESRH